MAEKASEHRGGRDAIALPEEKGFVRARLVAPAAAAATTAAVTILGPCFVDDERAPVELLAVQRFDRGGGLLSLGHRNETETA